MSDIEKILKGVVYGGVGVVASALEAGSDLARNVVQKGQEVVQKSQEAMQKAQEKAQEKQVEERQAVMDACREQTGIDVAAMTCEQREALRAALAFLVAEDKAKDRKGPEAGVPYVDLEDADENETEEQATEGRETEAEETEIDAEEEAAEEEEADEPEGPDDEANG